MTSNDCIEVRVHGVSGTPPEVSLGCPAATRVAGDRNAGFYRCWSRNGIGAPAKGGRDLEAYSWGGLTSGGPLRALWLLLLPFALVNVAFFTAAVPLGVKPDRFRVQAAPGRPGTGKPWRVTRRVLEAVLRLLGLALTAWSVLAAVCVAMDIVGWQYGRRPAAEAAETVGWLRFLHWGWLSQPERQYALTAVVPLLLVVVLWLLARHTWAVLERTQVPPANPSFELATPLEDRMLWNGERPVARLRGVHLSVALGIIAAALMLPMWYPAGAATANPLSNVWHRPDGPAVAIVSAAVIAFLAVAIGLACLPSMTDRDRPEDGQQSPGLIGSMHWAGLPLIVAAGVVVARGRYWHSAWPHGTTGALPGLATTLDVLFGVTIVLLVSATMLALALRWAMRSAYPEVTGPDEADNPATGTGPRARTPGRCVSTRPVWYGLAPGVLATIGALLMTGAAAGLTLAAARLLGHPVTALGAAREADGLLVPVAFEWAAAATTVSAIGAVLALVGVPVAVRLHQIGEVPEVRKEWDAAEMRKDMRQVLPKVKANEIRVIARAWARADAELRGLLLAAVLIAVSSVAAATVGYLADPSWISAHLHALVTLGIPTLAGVVVTLIYLGRQAFHNPQVRRTVGILWDVAAFWPRAAHPLAPPCYMERTLPALLARIEHTGDDASTAVPAGPALVVLSCHSQGTVIGAAVVAQLKLSTTKRVALLTYGSPLRRIYSRFFPAFFGTAQLELLGHYLSQDQRNTHTAAADSHLHRRCWRWRNLYRPSDMIGGPIFADYGHIDGPADDVDWWLLDPSLRWAEDDVCPPPINAHSGYPDDPQYETALEEITSSETPPLSRPARAA